MWGLRWMTYSCFRDEPEEPILIIAGFTLPFSNLDILTTVPRSTHITKRRHLS